VRFLVHPISINDAKFMVKWMSMIMGIWNFINWYLMELASHKMKGICYQKEHGITGCMQELELSKS